MKDYYYFLGLKKDATEEEIRRAYRKLSLKYHPDVNGDDDFFENRFREVQEAYDQLIDPEKRRFYDARLGAVPTMSRTSNPPAIRSFSASKIRVKRGDEIVLNWETQNADVVKILPFGLEKPSGERIFKITEFQNRQFHVVLQATNTLINKSVVKGITFIEVFDAEKNTQEGRFEAQEFYKTKTNKTSKKAMALALLMLLVLMLFLLIYLMDSA